MSMVLDGLAVESELGGVLDGTGLLCERPRRRRNSGEEQPGCHCLRLSISCARCNRWIQWVSPKSNVSLDDGWGQRNASKLRDWMPPKSAADVIERTPISPHFPIFQLSETVCNRVWFIVSSFYNLYNCYYLGLKGTPNTANCTNPADRCWAISNSRSPWDVQMIQCTI
jgi:hypothetical protein